MNTTINACSVQWRMLTEGSTVWAPFGDHGWHPGTVTGLGKNPAECTVVRLSFEAGGGGKRYAEQLVWRQPALSGKDKPKAEVISA
jgi:hypothetical protein